MYRRLFFLFFIVLLLTGCNFTMEKQSRDVLVLINSGSEQAQEATLTILPYLNHFEVPVKILDINKDPLPESLQHFALIVISHENLIPPGYDDFGKFSKFLKRMLNHGTGIVSFDPSLPRSISIRHVEKRNTTIEVSSFQVLDSNHYISSRHQPGKEFKLRDTLGLKEYSTQGMKMLLSSGTAPILGVVNKTEQKIVYWFSNKWMDPMVLGTGQGMDDFFWKSLVWAAKKPFVMKGLPPVVTMCIKESGGYGARWKDNPFYFAETAGLYGFKPWLGLNLMNISPKAARNLAHLQKQGIVISAPYSFGPVPNKNYNPQLVHPNVEYSRGSIPEYFDPAIQVSELKNYNEEIFFNSRNERRISLPLAEKNLNLVEQWYDNHADLDISEFLLLSRSNPTSYILGYVSDQWKVKYLALESGRFALKASASKKDSALINMFLSESKFRDSAIKNLLRTNIFNDIYKIEKSLYTLTFAPDNFMLWEPDNNIRRSVESAMQILNGSLNSMSLGILYTSELNHVCKIAPWNWNQEIRLITEKLESYDPLYLNMEEALTLMKNNENAKLLLSVYDPANNSMNTYLKGHTDGPVNLYLFTEEDGEIYSKRINVPPFEEQKEFSFLIDSH